MGSPNSLGESRSTWRRDRQRARHTAPSPATPNSLGVATSDLPDRGPFYTRLNALLDADGFDAFVEEARCRTLYARCWAARCVAWRRWRIPKVVASRRDRAALQETGGGTRTICWTHDEHRRGSMRLHIDQPTGQRDIVRMIQVPPRSRPQSQKGAPDRQRIRRDLTPRDAPLWRAESIPSK